MTYTQYLYFLIQINIKKGISLENNVIILFMVLYVTLQLNR